MGLLRVGTGAGAGRGLLRVVAVVAACDVSSVIRLVLVRCCDVSIVGRLVPVEALDCLSRFS